MSDRSLGGAPSWRRVLLSEHFVLGLSALLFLLALPAVPRLAGARNLANVLSNVGPLFAVAVGQTAVLVVRGIDLSQTAAMALASVLGALVMTAGLDPELFGGTPLWGTLVGPGGGPFGGGAAGGGAAAAIAGVGTMLAVGVLVGTLNGLAVARLAMPPFMVTLVSLTFFGALAVYLTRSENVTRLPDAFVALGGNAVGRVPWSLPAAGALGVAAHLLLSRTVLGHRLYAVGRNPRAAEVAGVPVARVTVFAYAFSGFAAAAGAALYTARLEAGRPTLGQNLLLDVVGATVIGGTSLFGGKGKVLWTLYGVLFFALLANVLNLLNLSFYTVNVVKGAVILTAALLDVARTRALRAPPRPVGARAAGAAA